MDLSRDNATVEEANELRSLVLRGVVSAVSIDTNIFEVARYQLEHGYLKHLEQFSKGDVRLVFSELTIGEVRAHMRRKSEEALSALQKGLAEMTTYWLPAHDRRSEILAGFTQQLDAAGKVEERIEGFLKRCNAIVIPATGNVDVSTLVQAYLESRAPFESSKKKHEFPDAIALMSLEAWAKANRTTVLFVTRDQGCQAFCQASNSLAWSDNIEEALAHFQYRRSHYDYPVFTLAEEVARGLHPALLESIKDVVERGIVDINWIVLANSIFDNINNQIVKVRVVEVAFDRDGAVPLFEAVDRDEKSMAIRAKLAVIVEVTCNFYFFVADNEGAGEVKLGRTQKEIEQAISLDALCTYSVEAGRLTSLIEAELVPATKKVNFGDVLPTSYD